MDKLKKRKQIFKKISVKYKENFIICAYDTMIVGFIIGYDKAFIGTI